MRHWLLGAYVVAHLAAVATPLGPMAQAWVGPRLLGLPFAFGWNGAWILASLVAYGGYHWAGGVEGRSR